MGLTRALRSKDDLKFFGSVEIRTRAAEWKALTPPLCNAAPPSTLLLATLLSELKPTLGVSKQPPVEGLGKAHCFLISVFNWELVHTIWISHWQK